VRLSFSTERFLLEQAHRLGDHGITIVYATGNHDPGEPESGPRSLPWPPNVRVADDATPQRIVVQGHDGDPVGYVTAIGHAHGKVRDDLSRRLPRPEGNLPEVALLHTQVHASPGSEAHHAYAPSELTYLLRSGFDYWALGHVHVRQALSEDPPIHYSGSLQGRTHTDTGPRGALLVDLSDRAAPSIAFRDLAPVRWATIRVTDIHDADSLDRLERRVALAWRTYEQEESVPVGTEWMVRVVLGGPCPLWRELRTEEDQRVLARELVEMLDVLDVVVVAEAVHPVVPIEDHRSRPDVMGEALRLAAAIRAGERTLTSLESGALAGTASDDPRVVEAYVRRLLEDVDGEIVARMLGADRGSS
jgi:exonuclease SbcD